MVVAGSSVQQIGAAATIERVTGQHIVAASDAVGIVGTDHGFEAEQPVALGLSAMIDIGRQVHGDRGRFGVIDLIAPSSPVEQVRARAADQLVVAVEPIERVGPRSEAHTSELQSLMRISYAVFCLKKTKHNTKHTNIQQYTK